MCEWDLLDYLVPIGPPNYQIEEVYRFRVNPSTSAPLYKYVTFRQTGRQVTVEKHRSRNERQKEPYPIPDTCTKQRKVYRNGKGFVDLWTDPNSLLLESRGTPSQKCDPIRL